MAGQTLFFRTYYISCRKTKNCYKNGYIRDWTSFHNVNIFLKVTFVTCWVVFFFFNISSLISRTIIPLWPFVVCMYTLFINYANLYVCEIILCLMLTPSSVSIFYLPTDIFQPYTLNPIVYIQLCTYHVPAWICTYLYFFLSL